MRGAAALGTFARPRASHGKKRLVGAADGRKRSQNALEGGGGGARAVGVQRYEEFATILFLFSFSCDLQLRAEAACAPPRAPSRRPAGRSRAAFYPSLGDLQCRGPGRRGAWRAALLRGRRFGAAWPGLRGARQAAGPRGARPAAPRSPTFLALALHPPSSLADLVEPSLPSAPGQAPWMRPRPCASAQTGHCPPC